MYLPSEMTTRTKVPKDIDTDGIVGEETLLYDPLVSLDRRSGAPLDNNAALIRILKNTDIDIMLRTIGNSFFPRVIPVQLTPTLLIAPNRSPRGYIMINPNQVSTGITTSITVFPAGTVFPTGVGGSTGASIPVSAVGGAAFILNVTEPCIAPGTVTVDLQTQDPISGNWATAQSDLFGFGAGAVANGTYYANVGAIGIDQNARIFVQVTDNTFTGSLAAILKPSLAGTVAGPTVFLGGPDVNTTIGFPLLSGQREPFYLKENTPLYGVATAVTNFNLFELQ